MTITSPFVLERDYPSTKSCRYDSDSSTCDADESASSSYHSSMNLVEDSHQLTPSRKDGNPEFCPYLLSTCYNKHETNDFSTLPSAITIPLITKNDIYPRVTVTYSDIRKRKLAPSHSRAKTRSQLSTSCFHTATTKRKEFSTSPTRRQINISLSIPPRSPIPVAKKIICTKSKQAQNILKTQNQKIQLKLKTQNQKLQSKVLTFRLKRKQRRTEKALRKQQQKRKSSLIVIPSNHRLKLLWDVLTIFITIISALQLHTYIRDRSTYEYDTFLIFTNVWFGVDLLLNFITDHRRSDGTVMRTGREVWGRYLTTWFAVDALSLLPWERIFIRPIIIMQNRRNILTKWLFRSRGVVRVMKFLGRRKYCIKYFGKLSKETSKVGFGGNKLLRILIKYIPKYLLFYRNMKGVLLLKTLRQVHYLRKISRGLTTKSHVHDDDSDDDDDDESVCSIDSNSISCENDDRDNEEEDFINLDLKMNLSLDEEKFLNYDHDIKGLLD